MAKIELNDVVSFTGVNARLQQIEDEFNNKVLYRNNPVGEPNTLATDVDANSKNLFNINDLRVINEIYLGGVPIADAVQGAAGDSAAEAAQSALDAAEDAMSAAASATAAANSATNAAGSLTTMNGLLLGAFASDPVSGVEGSLYYNTTVLELRYRRGGVWVSFPQASQVTHQSFVNGVDYTAGTTTVLTLPATSYTKSVLWIQFDTSYVQPNRYTLTDQTHITFTAPITAGTARIDIAYVAPLASIAVDDNSITTSKIQDSAVTTPKIADSAITAAKLSTAGVGDINLKLGVALAVDSIAAMKALPTGALSQYTWIDVAGYYGGLQGGGRFLVTNDTSITVNNGTVHAHTATGRRFLLDQIGPPTLYQFGAKLDGVSDDAAAVQFMTQVAGYDIRLPNSTTLLIGSPTTIPTQITFGSSSKILTTSTVNLVKKPIADPQQLIFHATGGGTFGFLGSETWDECSADWFNLGDIAPAINAAWKMSYCVTLNRRTYAWNSSAVPPAQVQGLVLKGKGFRNTNVAMANGIIGINYQRVAGQVATSLHVKDINFTENSIGHSSTCISFKGTANGAEGAETLFYDDNWLRVEGCVFLGYNRAIDTKYTTQSYFTDNYYQANNACHFMGRDSSFFYIRGEMALDNLFINGSYIFQQDATNDARTNGLNVTDCHSVLSAGIDVNLQNFQLACFINSSLDLGLAGAAAMYLNNCQDIHFDNGWVACEAGARAAGRVGVFSQTTRHSTFNGNTWNGCYVAFEGNLASSTSICDGAFDNSLYADILDLAGAVGLVCMGNKHKNNVATVPVQLGGSGNIVCNNIFRGGSYGINTGANSINTPNLFSVAFPV